MQIIIEVSISPTGRLSGRACPAGQPQWTEFSGAMELVGCIEALCENEAERTSTGNE